ncbi:hypothetical protein [Micromonospora sp. NPDC048947]|uniref:hypothetical protein n=1 Tax=Micromonospora sp. NPDC048947 TaxID=3154826 RepID=UPI0033CC3050
MTDRAFRIAVATSGEFGDVRFTRRTGGGDLFVNPLMAIYFAVGLDKLAARCLYLDPPSPRHRVLE